MIKKILTLFVLLVLLLGLSLAGYLYYLKPSYKGSAAIPGIQKSVKVYYDDYGIPHIYAQNDTDAMIALGYLHAKERLWQMELVSRIAAGRLSEIFGKKLLETDKFYLSLGIAKNAKKIVANIDKNTPEYRQTMAYLKGVNTFVKTGKTPVEFNILGIDKKTFKLEDIYNVYGYMAYGFAMGNQTDPLMSAIRAKLGDTYIKNLELLIDPASELIKTNTHTSVKEALTTAKILNELREKAPFPALEGSNAWVLGPAKTQNGKVILANDPHIGYSQPAVWYQAHINTPTTEIYGFYLALTPFPLLGHNHRMAYGLTMMENDDIDLYEEKINPENPQTYQYGDTYKKFTSYEVDIPVKDAGTVHYTIRESLHGPVINEVVHTVKTPNPVSMYWVYTRRPNQLLKATYTMSRAKTLEEFQQGPPLIHAPGLNVMYGDADNNIAWWAAAHLFQRANNTPTKLFLDGSKPENDAITYEDFRKNPQSVNPPWHYVYSCNNQPDSILSGRYVPGYYIAQDRAKRLVERIEAQDNWTLENTKPLATDITSSVAPELVRIISARMNPAHLNTEEKEAFEIWKKWDGKSGLNSVGVSLYTSFVYQYLQSVFQDELGEDIFKQLVKTHFIGRMIEPLIKGKYPIWIDDINTKNRKETAADIEEIAFKKAVKILHEKWGNKVSSWTWNRMHTVEHKHPLGEVALLRRFFNVGPFPINGTNEVLNNQMFFYRENPEYKVMGGPSSRRIIDFSDIENAVAIIPTGQSGHFMSKHYQDQAALFNQGKFIPMLLNEERIKKSREIFVLNPAP